jgi:hypothetical protein
MYTKRTYIVPQLNLKDGILLHIHGDVEGVEDVSPLSSTLELYEVTDLDGGNFTATKVTANSSAGDTIRGAFTDNSLRILEPANLRLCAPAHIGSRVPASESIFEETLLRVEHGGRDLYTAPIEYIYSDGVACSLDKKEDFAFKASAEEQLINFYEDFYRDSITLADLIPGGFSISFRVRTVFNTIEWMHWGDFIIRLTPEALNALTALAESGNYKKALDIAGKYVEGKYGAGSDEYKDYYRADVNFLRKVRPSKGETRKYPTEEETHTLTIAHLEGKLETLNVVATEALNDGDKGAVESAKRLLNDHLEVLRKSVPTVLDGDMPYEPPVSENDFLY